MPHRFVALCAFSLVVAGLSAQQPPPGIVSSVATPPATPMDSPNNAASESSRLMPTADDPATCLGANLEEVFRALGAPRSVTVARGLEPWQDDVVFRYHGFDLFLFQDRVWQVRAERILGLAVGEIAENAVARLGQPQERQTAAYIFQIQGTAWPRCLRVGFGLNGLIQHLYLYRADF